jgi:hypothetical protein
MNFHLGNDNEKGVHNKDVPPSNFFYFVVEVGPNPQSIESYTEKVFAGVGLKTKSSIKAFDRFMGQAFFRSMINNAANDPGISAAVKNPQGKVIEIKVRVFPSVVESLRRFGINLLTNSKGKTAFNGYAATFTKNVKKFEAVKAAPETPVSQWTTVQKLDSVIRRAALLLPEDVGKQLLNLLEPWALALMAFVLGLWLVGHFFVASEIADAVLLAVGGVFLGLAAFQAGEHLASFAIKCVGGRTEKDLDESAHHLSEAIALIGVQTVMALLLAKATKVLRESKSKMYIDATPYTMKNIGTPPITKGKLFYEPEIVPTDNLTNPFGTSGGITDQWGNTTLILSKIAKEAEVAKIHEAVHRFLTPKLQLLPKLRQFRAVLRQNGYLRSYILRYLEEALAETIAQLKVNGINWRNLLSGIKFPLKEAPGGPYVSIQKIGVEAKGFCLDQ